MKGHVISLLLAMCVSVNAQTHFARSLAKKDYICTLNSNEGVLPRTASIRVQGYIFLILSAKLIT